MLCAARKRKVCRKQAFLGVWVARGAESSSPFSPLHPVKGAGESSASGRRREGRPGGRGRPRCAVRSVSALVRVRSE
eukprot:6191464-Pleurochrysis_carterae.AAC.1